MNKVDTAFLSDSPVSRLWEEIGIKNHHGMILPLFSLHSAQSYGIGEYPDLIPMIKWCVTCSFDVIQLLPLNDTGLDTSPYNAISAFALNPIHIGLAHLPHLADFPQLQDKLGKIPKQPHAVRINYSFVRENKERFLKHYYEIVGPHITSTDSYQRFTEQSPWLNGYALFKTLKAKHQWVSWEHWPVELQQPNSEMLIELLNQYKEDVQWHIFIQYLCDFQLSEAKKEASKCGIFLMGDIPILIGRDSADVWLHRHLFLLDYSAGSKPDMFSAEGQNWGFPIYNWEVLSTEKYKWWIERLELASRYYHIYRIDHIVGFFRIWTIPKGVTSKEGHYMPRDPNLWIDHGKKIMMMMIEQCSMLPIGEDLGNVPPPVRTCLKDLGICGTKVMRWERNWDQDRSFIPIDQYSPASMSTVSTHDSETLQMWWKYITAEAMDYAQFKGWSYQPSLSREYHYEILKDSHHSNSLFHINLLQEYFVLIPGLTWPNLEDERINIPGICSDKNWSYRFKPSVEEIVNNQTLTHLLREMAV